MALLRLLERIGLTILVACGISIVTAAISLQHSRPALSLVEILLAIGFISGAVWGIVRRPTVFQAALEVDRQTNSAELFSSALIVSQTADFRANAWSGAVVAAAEQRRRDASMSKISLARFGARAWGGIVLALTLVFALVMLGPAQSHDQGMDVAVANRAKSSTADRPEAQSANSIALAINRPIILPDPDDLNPNSFGQNQTSSPDPSNAKPAAADPSDAQTAKPSSDGNGGKTARTKPPANSAKAQLTEHAPGALASPSNNPGPTAAGSGSSPGSTPPAQPSNATGDNATASQAVQPSRPLPWDAANWPAQVELAHKAIDAGGVPAGYRDLIRDYFSRSRHN
jgi:hypothetical protein